MSTNPPSAEYGSDIVVDLMRAFDVEYAAFNPGATFRGIHDSIVNYGGNRKPEIIECCHEEISVAIAHGYAKATGKPMVAIVHNIVGLQHASMAIFNAWCDRVPVIVLGATGPMDATRRRAWIDWIHTALVQGNLVRDYVKWDDQPYSVASIPESFLRGYRTAVTEPCGPVYLCYDADLQETRLSEPVVIPDISRYVPPSPTYANPEAVRRAAGLLVDSKNPVIIAGTVGRNPTGVEHLIHLAELLAAPVLDRGNRFNFPNTHPLDLTGGEVEVLRDADVVLALDVPDLFGALGSVDKATRKFTYHIGSDVRIIGVSLNDMLIKSWAADYHRLQPVDVPIAADTATAIPQIIAACEDMGATRDTRRPRFEAMRARHDELRERWRSVARAEVDHAPISSAKLAADVWEAIRVEDWILANGVLKGWARRLWDWTQPYQYLGASGGAGLGYGIGAALGAALAYRDTDKLCVSLQDDGDFLFSSSALWTAAHHRLPLLIVMNNNRTYYNSEEHQAEVARVRGRDMSKAGIGNLITDPPIDFARLAQSFGLYGEGPIDRPDEVLPAIHRAVKVIKEQRIAALVDVVTSPGPRLWGE